MSWTLLAPVTDDDEGAAHDLGLALLSESSLQRPAQLPVAINLDEEDRAKAFSNLLFIGSSQLAARTQRSLALVKSLGGLVEAMNLTLVDEADLEDLLDGRVDAHGE